MYRIRWIVLLSVLCWSMTGDGDAAAVEKKPNPVLPNGWRVHDLERPVPTVVVPGRFAGDAPSDAIILFDGESLDAWVGTVITNKKKKYNPRGEVLWQVRDGYMEVTPTGDISTRQAFGDCQLHLEWSAPVEVKGDSQNRGNSGVFLMGRYEIQLLDCYENESYADGMAAAIYGQTPAQANACRPPGEWQSYDIFFKAPRFEGERLVQPAYVTVVHNGVLVQLHQPFLGPTRHKKLPNYQPHAARAPLRLQDHSNPVRFRNIWIREL